MRTWPRKASNAVGGGLVITLFIVFVVQVTARFGFNKPLAWTDEAAVTLYVWAIQGASAFSVPQREQVVFDLAWNSVGLRARQAMQIAGNRLVGGLVGGLVVGLVVGLARCGIPGSWDCVRFVAREGTPVLGLPFMWVFMPFVLLLVALMLRSAWAIWEALHRRGLDAELRL